MKTNRAIFKNFLSLLASDAATRMLGTILTIYAARVLGVKSFGQLAFAAAFVSYFNIFADLGLTNFGIREIAKSKTKTNTYATHILVLQISVSLFLLMLLVLIVNLIPFDGKIKTMVLLFGFGMIPTALDMSYLFQAHEKMEFIVYAKSLSQLVYVLTGFTLIYRYKDIVFLPAANLVGLTVGSLAIYFLLKNQIKLKWSRVTLQKLKSIAKAALPFLTGALMIHIYFNSSTLMLQFYKGVEAVGLYNASNKIILFILGLSGFLTWAVYPALSKSYGRRRATFNRLVEFSAWAFGSAAIPTAVGGVILARGIIGWLYGNDYAAAFPVFAVLIISPIFVFLNCVFGNALSSSGHQKVSTLAVTIAAVVNIALNLIFIPMYGILGAAAVSIVTEIVEVVYLHIASKKLLGTNILQIYFVKPLIASIPMAISVWLLPLDWAVLIKIMFGGLVYLAAFYTIGGFKRKFARKLL